MQAELALESELNASIEYLSSPAMYRAFEVDPYWPKWDSPWWHMTLMWELGLAHRIPKVASARWVEALNSHYIRTFPFTEADIPEGVDPLLDIMCHCGMGTAYQVLRAAGVDVDSELSWVREWMLQYQMQEGGWNCDEEAYVKTPAKSSVVSSVPILEALLSIPNRTPAEDAALDKGIAYLLDRKLFRARSSRKVIDEAWLQLTFPRFYEYDILRGLSLVANWAEQRQKDIDKDSIDEAFSVVESKIVRANTEPGLPVERQFHTSCGSRVVGTDGQWCKGDSSVFPLLVASSRLNEVSPALTGAWTEAKQRLAPRTRSNGA